MFLVGKGIPEHIRALPEQFLNTPLGQMLKPQIDMALRGFVQGDGGRSRQNIPSSMLQTGPPLAGPQPLYNGAAPPVAPKGRVINVSSLRELQLYLASASKSCAVIFFTSSTCAPCKMVYPTYDELSEEAGLKAVLIKVDLDSAFDVSAHYGVRATPTFMTFLKGKKDSEWSGANAAQLRGNVRMLIQMAFPPHPHHDLRLPSLQRKLDRYVTYTKMPPLEKLQGKLSSYGTDPTVTALVTFIKTRSSTIPAEVALPDLSREPICTGRPDPCRVPRSANDWFLCDAGPA
jgi:desumoylating isopeptidase 1